MGVKISQAVRAVLCAKGLIRVSADFKGLSLNKGKISKGKVRPYFLFGPYYYQKKWPVKTHAPTHLYRSYCNATPYSHLQNPPIPRHLPHRHYFQPPTIPSASLGQINKWTSRSIPNALSSEKIISRLRKTLSSKRMHLRVLPMLATLMSSFSPFELLALPFTF
ncbi:hypothetical protein DL96DRAFT_120242 [Flagelloscypha sp. PMI_526]|nr:hypothetical protein DL96DRAFT_120242 [Flagelloscypha sp. PMI_526]